MAPVHTMGNRDGIGRGTSDIPGHVTDNRCRRDIREQREDEVRHLEHVDDYGEFVVQVASAALCGVITDDNYTDADGGKYGH